jgi:hypothetical protein
MLTRGHVDDLLETRIKFVIHFARLRMMLYLELWRSLRKIGKGDD